MNSDCALKICDFGLARGVSLPAEKPESTKGPMTEYVATRWYRAPEIMLSSSNYSKAIDVWSAGCIFAELLGGKVLFPGKDYVHQMSLIINIVGTPNDATLDKIGSEKAKEWVHNMPYKEKVALAKLFPDAEPLGKRPSLSLSLTRNISLSYLIFFFLFQALTCLRSSSSLIPTRELLWKKPCSMSTWPSTMTPQMSRRTTPSTSRSRPWTRSRT